MTTGRNVASMTNSPAAGPTFDPATVKAVVFDIGGVFTYPHYRPVEAKLTELGLATPADTIEYRRAHHVGVHALAHATGPFDEFDEREQDFWAVYDHAYARSLGVPDELLEAYRTVVRSTWNWAHQENIDAFHRLHATGIKTAIVSNNSGTAPEQMIQHGVCQVLAGGPLPRVYAIIDSSLVGVAKPDPMIMAPALYALGVEAGEALYVGDTVQADVAGAVAAGMQVVQLDPFDTHAEYAHSRVVDVQEIIDQLAAAGSI